MSRCLMNERLRGRVIAPAALLGVLSAALLGAAGCARPADKPAAPATGAATPATGAAPAAGQGPMQGRTPSGAAPASPAGTGQ